MAGILTMVAHRAHFASAETVYRRWRAAPGQASSPRWAGDDRDVRPALAFVHEAKIVSFWPYRAGLLEVLDTYEATVMEVLTAYLQALAAWTSDNVGLAACSPSGPPACVAEDLRVVANRAGSRWPNAQNGDHLAGLGARVVELVLEDLSMTPLGAFNAVRYETSELFADLEEIADQVTYSIVEFSDHLLHQADDQTLIDVDRARRMVAALDELKTRLTSTVLAQPRPDAQSARE
jgi:hypothetical protein